MKNMLLIEDDETNELLVIPHSSISYLIAKKTEQQGEFTLLVLNNGKTQMLDMPIKDAYELFFKNR
ncbi:hypothetical protein [Hafnia psychrotolerans]|uniref:Uncharacterized protein n=1 Tax=Hafnia psychrotolerans TaxID=1477018 RepID=A0ABQ1G7V1_9GAMM|nr:hypothetical protein [Hafnia psychrotolerans]GGA38477.1 hypothetical protein GCM10011328_11640 [Hafnia psychrotolerans]